MGFGVGEGIVDEDGTGDECDTQHGGCCRVPSPAWKLSRAVKKRSSGHHSCCQAGLGAKVSASAHAQRRTGGPARGRDSKHFAAGDGSHSGMGAVRIRSR